MKNDTTKNPSNPKCKLRYPVKRSVSLSWSAFKDRSCGEEWHYRIEEM